MKALTLSHPSGILEGTISLEGSKSIANRVLIIRALCPNDFEIKNLPGCDDALVLQKALNDPDNGHVNVNLAGTAGRFLTAFYAFRKGTQIIDANEGLRNRPLKPLLDALRTIGCSIESMHENDRFPIRILPFEGQKADEVTLSDNISSQFVTALLLMAPTLPGGLTIHLSPNQVSASYIDMTIQVMAYFNVFVEREGLMVRVRPQTYMGKNIIIEGDWSSASYYVGMAALSKSARITLEGLYSDSWQGDTNMLKTCSFFGLTSHFEGDRLIISKNDQQPVKPYIEFDFSDSPDLFQTVSVTAAALSMQGMFTGLGTLPYKESDRISAIQQELLKCGVFLNKMPEKFARKKNQPVYFMEGNFQLPGEDIFFETYRDHRMAMSLALLGLKGKIKMHDPYVVNKSYPSYWQDLVSLGFVAE